MNCRASQKALMAGSAEPGSALDRHRQGCPDCARFARRLEASRELLGRRANPAASAPSDFASRVTAALPEPMDPLAWAALRLLPATTALALVLLGWCWLATPSPGELWAEAGDDQVLTWISSEGKDEG